MAMSPGNVWLNELSVTFTLPGVVGIFPDIPETTIDEGYGDAFPTVVGIVIGVLFVNVAAGSSSATFLVSRRLFLWATRLVSVINVMQNTATQ
jgi:hypothetical protein